MYSLRSFFISLLALAAGTSCIAQSIISARSGVLNSSEGAVFIGDESIEQHAGQFPSIGEGVELRTEQGRAEVLLTPGVFLRLGENSAIRMVSSRLSDTRVEFLKGSAILETSDALKDNSVTLVYRKYDVRFPRKGVFRLNSEPEQLQVYKGEAEVLESGQRTVVGDGQMLLLTGTLATRAFHPALGDGPGEGDSLDEWDRERSSQIAAANSPPVQGAPDDVDPLLALLGGTWYTNPLFGLSTYIPTAGALFGSAGYGYLNGYPGSYLSGYPGGYSGLSYRGLFTGYSPYGSVYRLPSVSPGWHGGSVYHGPVHPGYAPIGGHSPAIGAWRPPAAGRSGSPAGVGAARGGMSSPGGGHAGGHGR